MGVFIVILWIIIIIALLCFPHWVFVAIGILYGDKEAIHLDGNLCDKAPEVPWGKKNKNGDD